ncbi:MAG TPA: L-2-hydroxyglutarate oxidase [Gemmatimonadales bacterium]|nr:L-2-hydroxyglutarate oxidase [Gemmatimonadales bacterium]
MAGNAERTVVVGGGIVGMATALSLTERGCPVVVLEAESRLAPHQTGHNSGVIHSGLYYKPGSLKARTCRDGLTAMYRFCEEEGVPHRRTGKLVVATQEAQLPRLATLEERGRANGVTLRRLNAAEIRDREPEVKGIAGLWIEDTGIVNYTAVTEAMAGRLTRLGGEVRTGCRVLRIRRGNGGNVLETTQGPVPANQLVNCAGLQSDRIARMAGFDPGIRIVPFRGEYYTLRPERAGLVRGLIYPVPDPALPFLGVHFTRGIDGVVEAGPNAVLAFRREGYRWRDVSLRDVADWAAFPGFWRMVRSQWRNGLDEMRRSLSRSRFLTSLQALLPTLTDADIAPGGSGVRAQAVDRSGRLLDDFALVQSPGQVHVLNAPSPAATASLAIGKEIASQLLGSAPA